MIISIFLLKMDVHGSCNGVFCQKTHFRHVKHVKIGLKMAEIPPFGFPFYTRENQKEAISDIYRLILKCFNIVGKTKSGFFWTFIGQF